MNQAQVVLIDLITVAVLVFGVYFPRHRRRDLVVAYLGVNVGVLAVSTVLSGSTISFGLGLGLFGVLSIIRLRSYEIEQNEIAYYFASLAIGLLAGLTPVPSVFTISLMALIVATLWLGDHPKLYRGYRQQLVVVGRVIADEAALKQHLEELLGGSVRALTVKRVDTVNDSMTVDVRYRIP